MVIECPRIHVYWRRLGEDYWFTVFGATHGKLTTNWLLSHLNFSFHVPRIREQPFIESLGVKGLFDFLIIDSHKDDPLAQGLQGPALARLRFVGKDGWDVVVTPVPADAVWKKI